MSVLIKGLEIPEEGAIRVVIQKHCGIAVAYTGEDPYRRAHEVAELPEKHGRLVDADVLLLDFELAQKSVNMDGREYANAFRSPGGELSTEWWAVEELIHNAKTVIDAEGE